MSLYDKPAIVISSAQGPQSFMSLRMPPEARKAARRSFQQACLHLEGSSHR